MRKNKLYFLLIALLLSASLLFGACDDYVSEIVNDIDVTTDIDVKTDVDTGSFNKHEYVFRNSKLLNQHYEKHGIEMGFSSAEEYETAAAAVVNNSKALHKIEAEDGDDVYYLEETNEFVIVSTDGYIRTYFNPNAGKKYFDRQ